MNPDPRHALEDIKFAPLGLIEGVDGKGHGNKQQEQGWGVNAENQSWLQDASHVLLMRGKKRKHQGSATSSQNLGSPAETLQNTLAWKDVSIEGDDVRSMPMSRTPATLGRGDPLPLAEPVDSGTQNYTGCGTFDQKHNASSTSKIWVDPYGWSHQRKGFSRGKAVGVSQASKIHDKKHIREGDVDAFVDLGTTTIDIANAPYLRNSIDALLGKYKCRYLTIYALYPLAKPLHDSLCKGDVTFRFYHQRDAVCGPCKPLQARTQKFPLLDSEIVTDIGRLALELKMQNEMEKPIVVITNDEHGVSKLADVLEGLSFTIVRTLPAGMTNKSMYKDLSEAELSVQQTERSARLHHIRAENLAKWQQRRQARGSHRI